MNDLALKINPDPQLIYDYNDCLARGVCLQCGKKLEWNLDVGPKDDRFCYAVCCTTRYSMIPDKVRIIGTFAYPLSQKEMDEEELSADEDFIKQLQEM